MEPYRDTMLEVISPAENMAYSWIILEDDGEAGKTTVAEYTGSEVVVVFGQKSQHTFVLHEYSRARSLRNLLVSGNECGRVFPAGVGPGSPSRDAANWLPSRFSLSVETRRRYGWLRMMVFPGARLFPSPNLVPFGRVAARERQGALSRRAW